MPATPLPLVGDEVADPAFAAFASGERYEWGSDRAPVVEPQATALDPALAPAPVVPNALPDAPRPVSFGATDRATGGATTATPPLRRRAPSTLWWITALGGAGFTVAAVGAALFATQMGYDWRLAAQIGALAGVAGGALGAMLPAVARALGWALLASVCGAAGGAALWFLTRVAPAFTERVVDLVR